MPTRSSEIPEISTRHLRAIVALARSGKFVAAAADLGMSQPGLSRLIQQAEKVLGTPLFLRATRSVSQTAAGREFIPTAERLLTELVQRSRAIRNLDGQLRGQVTIASLMSIAHYVLPAALVAFRRQHPRIYIQMREGIASDVLEDVRSGTADFGIGSIPERHREISVTSIVEEPCYVVLPPKHRLADRASVRFRDLAGEPMISMPPDSGLRRLVDAVAHAENVMLHHSITTNQFPSLFDFVAEGLGVSIAPASSLDPSLARSVSSRPLRPPLTRRVGILHLADRQLSDASLAFLQIFRPLFLAAIRGKKRGRARTRRFKL